MNELTLTDKIVYSAITSLLQQNGYYCYATNAYLVEIMNLKPKTISGIIRKLKKLNYITSEVIRKDGKEVIERKIYINEYNDILHQNRGRYASRIGEGILLESEYNIYNTHSIEKQPERLFKINKK